MNIKNKFKNIQKGFTLVELIVVILIVGILAALALSKYVTLSQDARIAKAQAIFGAVKTAAFLANASCLLDLGGVSPAPTCTAVAGTVTMTGGPVSPVNVNMVNQYPAATLLGIITATQFQFTVAAPFTDVGNGVIYIISTGAGTPVIITVVGATQPAANATVATCGVAYVAAAAGAAPAISLGTAGC